MAPPLSRQELQSRREAQRLQGIAGGAENRAYQALRQGKSQLKKIQENNTAQMQATAPPPTTPQVRVYDPVMASQRQQAMRGYIEQQNQVRADTNARNSQPQVAPDISELEKNLQKARSNYANVMEAQSKGADINEYTRNLANQQQAIGSQQKAAKLANKSAKQGIKSQKIANQGARNSNANTNAMAQQQLRSAKEVYDNMPEQRRMESAAADANTGLVNAQTGQVTETTRLMETKENRAAAAAAANQAVDNDLKKSTAEKNRGEAAIAQRKSLDDQLSGLYETRQAIFKSGDSDLLENNQTEINKVITAINKLGAPGGAGGNPTTTPKPSPLDVSPADRAALMAAQQGGYQAGAGHPSEMTPVGQGDPLLYDKLSDYASGASFNETPAPVSDMPFPGTAPVNAAPATDLSAPVNAAPATDLSAPVNAAPATDLSAPVNAAPATDLSAPVNAAPVDDLVEKAITERGMTPDPLNQNPLGPLKSLFKEALDKYEEGAPSRELEAMAEMLEKSTNKAKNKIPAPGSYSKINGKMVMHGQPRLIETKDKPAGSFSVINGKRIMHESLESIGLPATKKNPAGSYSVRNGKRIMHKENAHLDVLNK